VPTSYHCLSLFFYYVPFSPCIQSNFFTHRQTVTWPLPPSARTLSAGGADALTEGHRLVPQHHAQLSEHTPQGAHLRQREITHVFGSKDAQLSQKFLEFLKLVLELHPRRPVFGLRRVVFYAFFCYFAVRKRQVDTPHTPVSMIGASPFACRDGRRGGLFQMKWR